jgi:DNA polymerase I
MTGVALPAAFDRFHQVWACDFEFIAPPGERPDPVCAVFRELRTAQEVRFWDDELRTRTPPLGPGSLFVSYNAVAELACFKVLGWPMPAQVLDPMIEFWNFVNGRRDVLGVKGGLLDALGYFGLSRLDPDTKKSWIDRILIGRPYSDDEREGILDYCASDTVALEHLLPVLAARLQGRPHWLEHALLRGRFMAAVASMEHTGVPVDAELLARLLAHWHEIKVELISTICADIPIFEGATLKQDRFERWLAVQGIAWPRTPTGRLSQEEQTFKDMVKVYPQVAPIREVHSNLGKLRLADLLIGTDGRNRASLMPFRARTGRNQPSNAKFIFGPSVWLRHLIRPGLGRALAYIDFASQEVGIAAALSGDEAMIEAYTSGDPYLSFAVQAGLAPADATKKTHKPVRDRCKALVLGTLFGQQQYSLAQKLSTPLYEARLLLEAHRRTFAKFWSWSQRRMDHALLLNYTDTCFGWRLHVTHATKPTSLLNHPMQSHGAEMLRLACCFMVEAGIAVCAPIHDAVLIEAADTEIEGVVEHAQQLMRKAGRIVTGGLEIGTEATIIRPGERYADERGVEMWARVMELLKRIETSHLYREAA